MYRGGIGYFNYYRSLYYFELNFLLIEIFRIIRNEIISLKNIYECNRLNQIRMTTIASVSVCIKSRIMTNYKER